MTTQHRPLITAGSSRAPAQKSTFSPKKGGYNINKTFLKTFTTDSAMDHRGNSSPLLDHKSNSSTFLDHKSNSSTFLDHKSNSSTFLDHKSNSSTFLDNQDNSFTFFDHQGNRSTLLDHRGNSLTLFNHRDNSSTLFDHQDKSSSLFDHRDNISTVFDHRGNSSSFLDNQGNSSTFSDHRGNSSTILDHIKTENFDRNATNKISYKINCKYEECNLLGDIFNNTLNDTEQSIFENSFNFTDFYNGSNSTQQSSTPEIAWNHSFIVDNGDYFFNVTSDEYLNDLNRSFARLLLPAVVVLAVLMVAGAVGNAFVLYVYSCRIRGSTITRFIQALAVFDLLSCCVAIPGEIIDMANNYTFGRDPLCKVVRTVNLFCTMASGGTLVIVAIDRYKRICCPLRRQIPPKGAVIITSSCAVVSLIISLPTAYFYGSRTIYTDIPSIQGSDCSISDQFVGTIFPLVYNSLQMFLFLVGAVTLSILYALVGSRVCRHIHLQLARRQSINLSRSRFSPYSPSIYSSHSYNTDNAGPLESDKLRTAETESSTHFNGKEKAVQMKGDSKTNIITSLKENNTFSNKTKTESISDVILMSQQGNDLRNIEQNVTSLTENNTFNNKSKIEDINDEVIVTNKRKDFGDIEKVGNQNESEVTQISSNTCPHVSKDRNTLDVTDTHEMKTNSSIESGQEILQTMTPTSGNKLANRFIPNADLSSSGKYSQNEASRANLQKVCEQSQELAQSTNCSFKPKTSIESNFTSTHDATSPPGTPLERLENPTRHLLESSNTRNKLREHEDCSFSKLRTPEESKNLDDEVATGIETQNMKTKRANTPSFKQKYANGVSKQRKTNSSSEKIDSTQNKTPHSKSDHENCNESSGTEASSFILRRQSRKDVDDQGRRRRFVGFIYSSEYPRVGRNVLNMSSVAGKVEGAKIPSSEDTGKVKENKHGSRRTTLMLFLITAVYVLSFLPHLVIMAIKALNERSLTGHGESWELAYNLLIRSYFINSAANPIIYSFFSKNFFRECKSLICFRQKNGTK